MENTFLTLGLKEEISKGLEKSKITVPTDIQKKVIPFILEKKDIIAQSETGTGKTLAYLLPVFQNLDTEKGTQVMILAPTHELASQIKKQSETLAKDSNLNISSALIIGEVNIKRQIDKLKEKPNLIIGSAGRILELISKKKINAQNINTLVLDEADYMLDKKNIDNVRKVVKTLSKERQTLLFSASILHTTIEIAKEIMNNPELIRSDAKNTVPDTITHSFYVTENKTPQKQMYVVSSKVELLRKLINVLKPKKSLVFVKHTDDLEDLTENTKYHGLKVAALFGNQSKEDRKKMLDDFRKGKISILFATDIAARGLDIKDISHVFNLDFPRDAKTYLHRAGRTGRNGEKGNSISLVANDEKHLIEKFERSLQIKIKQEKV